MTRNRTNEAGEQVREARRAARLCELCEKPTRGTRRCTDCTRTVEANTERYRGQGKRGAPSALAGDLSDLRSAFEALDAGIRGFAMVETSREANRRRQRELLIEPRSRIALAHRFLGEVLGRNPPPESEQDADALPPLDEAVPKSYEERKLAGLCVQCGRLAADDSSLCKPHRKDARARARRVNAERRGARRRAGRCIDCGSRTKRYRCKKCRAHIAAVSENKSVNKGPNRPSVLPRAKVVP